MAELLELSVNLLSGHHLLLACHRRLRRLRAGEGATGWNPSDFWRSIRSECRYSIGQDGNSRETRGQGLGYTHQDIGSFGRPRSVRAGSEWQVVHSNESFDHPTLTA